MRDRRSPPFSILFSLSLTLTISYSLIGRSVVVAAVEPQSSFKIPTPIVEEEIFIKDSSDTSNNNNDDDNADDEFNNSFVYDTPSLEHGITYNLSLAAVNHLRVPGTVAHFYL